MVDLDLPEDAREAMMVAMVYNSRWRESRSRVRLKYGYFGGDGTVLLWIEVGDTYMYMRGCFVSCTYMYSEGKKLDLSCMFPACFWKDCGSHRFPA